MPADSNFEALLASHNQEYANAEVFSQWMPPEGEHIISVEKLDRDVTPQEDGSDMLWWSLRCRIEGEGALVGRRFSIFSSSKAYGIFKGIVEALNGGEPVDGIAAANVVMEDAVGKVLRIESTETYSKKAKRNFTNIAILEILKTEEVVEAGTEAEVVEVTADDVGTVEEVVG